MPSARICNLIKMKQPEFNSGLLFASGATVPGAVSGYQTGCIFQKTDGGIGTALYVNEGSATSASFKKVATLDSAEEFDQVNIDLGLDHAIYVTTDDTALTKNAFRAGDYATPIDVAAGYGAFRLYGKYSSGTDASTLGFVRALAENTAQVSAFQFYSDSDASTPGPVSLHGVDFFAVVNDGKYLALGGELGDGLVSSWHKVTAPVGAHVDGNVWTVWLDNQVSAAVGGTEATILSTTGGSKPDAWAYFSTTSGGWASLFEFDTAAAAQDPVVTNALVPAAAPDAGTMGADKALKVIIDGTPYYIPLYDTLHS